MAYTYARLPNAGLANRLFSWARSVVYSRIHTLACIEPTWGQLKLGPLLRQEKDARLYFRLFRATPAYIHGLRKYGLLAIGKKVAEPQDLQVRLPDLSANTIVVFDGWRDLFTPLNGWQSLLRQELIAITRPEHLQAVEALGTIPIAFHIRRGDFATAANAGELHTKGGVRTPLEWYQQVLTLIRAHVGKEVPAYVFSDGTEQELAPLLALPQVRFAQTGSAIGDIHALSRAQVVIGTGGSSFSAWAIFLGKMPSVVHPGQSLSWFGLQHPDDTYLDVFDPTTPDPEFLRQAVARLQ